MFIVGENQKPLTRKIIKELLKFKPFRGKHYLIQAFDCKDLGSRSKIKFDPIKIKAFLRTKEYFGKTTRQLNSLATNQI